MDDIFEFIAGAFIWVVGIFCGLAFILLVVVLPFGIAASVKEDNRLMQQCLGDGHKEYECKVIMRSGQSSSTVTPMPIVVR